MDATEDSVSKLKLFTDRLKHPDPIAESVLPNTAIRNVKVGTSLGSHQEATYQVSSLSVVSSVFPEFFSVFST